MFNREIRRVQEKSKQSAQKRRMADAQKKKSASREKGDRNFLKKIAQFLKDVRIEMKKVIWPSREEVLNYTVVVLVTVTVVATYVLLLDLGLSRLLSLIIS